MLDHLTLAWFAGVVDARAHIEATMRHGKPQPRLSVTTRQMELLQVLADLTGTNISLDTRGYTKRPCSDHCNESHMHVNRQSAKWRCDASRATIVLHAIEPYIRAKRPQVLDALEVGMAAYPAAKGDTGKQMVALGWPLPDRAEWDERARDRALDERAGGGAERVPGEG